MRRHFSLSAALSLLVLAGCATMPVPPPAPPPGAPAAAPLAPSPPVLSEAQKFQAFIREFETRAVASGITRQTYDRAMAGIAPVPSIATIVAEQPEFVRPVWSYLDNAVSPKRVEIAKKLLVQYAGLLDGIEARTGVPKEILVAIWGMETDYGRDLGRYNLFATLATQAWQGPRQFYAGSELIAALRLLQQNDYAPAEMVSSWAGAIGQTQFMPSTFFKYAADGDGDGKIDLWHSAPDALASTAALFQQQGWQAGKPWGYEVRLPTGFPYQEADPGNFKSLTDWAAEGVTLISGKALPEEDDRAALYLPAGGHGPAFLTLNNFRAIMKYNNAASYALAVGLLADRMRNRPGVEASWPRGEKPLSRAERLRFQTDLTLLGYDAGQPDGLLGRKTRFALRQYQLAHGLSADAYPTEAMLLLLDQDAGKLAPSPASAAPAD